MMMMIMMILNDQILQAIVPRSTMVYTKDRIKAFSHGNTSGDNNGDIS